MQFDTRSLWIYINFPRLQLDLIESSIATELNNENTPRAIVDAKSNRLCQVNEAALKYGIHLDMGLASASLLCADLQLHEHNQDIESQHVSNIAKDLYLLTSDIVLCPPSALILRAQNMLNLYGGLASYWRIIEHTLNQQKLSFIAASAYSVQAAKLLALNKQGSITSKRNAIAENLKQCLLTLSDIDEKDTFKLKRIGINTYGDLLTLPLSELANRVSRFSMGIINELAGKQAAKVKFHQPSPNYQDYLELLYEISIADKLLPVIKQCVSKLSQFLLLRNAYCLSIKIHFYQRDHDFQPHIFNSMRPIYKADDWLEIIALQLESVKFESPVYAISVLCDKYEVAAVSNDDMFTQKSTHIARLTLLSRLQGKLGKENVQQIQFVADHRPEKSSKQTSFYASSNNNTIHSKPNVFADRPGLLLKHPKPLCLQAQVIKGPERIQTGWWDDNPVWRDYYIGQSANGQQLWIFKTPNHEWFLHGFFI